jgi:hypothetical protein
MTWIVRKRSQSLRKIFGEARIGMLLVNQNNRLGIRQRWHLTQTAVSALRDAFRASERSNALRTRSDVVKWFGSPPETGTLNDALVPRLQSLLRTDRSTGFDTHDLRGVAGAFRLEQALGIENKDRAESLYVILSTLSAGSSLPKPVIPSGRRLRRSDGRW